MNAELQKVVDKIHDAANIVDVIGEFLTLKKAGVNYKGICPFHDDRNPSFFVSPAKQCYKCFVCGEGGDVFTFLQKHEEMTFFEAVEWLCKKYSIDPPKREMSEEEQEALDNMPESIQCSDRGECAQAKIDTIGDAMTDLESSIDNLNEVLGE